MQMRACARLCGWDWGQVLPVWVAAWLRRVYTRWVCVRAREGARSTSCFHYIILLNSEMRGVY